MDGNEDLRHRSDIFGFTLGEWYPHAQAMH